MAFAAWWSKSIQPKGQRPQSVRPKSAVGQCSAMASLCGALGVLALFKWLDNRDTALCLVTVAVFIALPQAASALASWPSPPISNYRKKNRTRVAIKLWGQLCLFASLGLAYFVFRGFSEAFLLPVSRLGKELILLLLLATPPYLWFTDLRMANQGNSSKKTTHLPSFFMLVK